MNMRATRVSLYMSASEVLVGAMSQGRDWGPERVKAPLDLSLGTQQGNNQIQTHHPNQALPGPWHPQC